MINFEQLEKNIESLRIQYLTAQPFPHLIIDMSLFPMLAAPTFFCLFLFSMKEPWIVLQYRILSFLFQ